VWKNRGDGVGDSARRGERWRGGGGGGVGCCGGVLVRALVSSATVSAGNRTRGGRRISDRTAHRRRAAAWPAGWPRATAAPPPCTAPSSLVLTSCASGACDVPKTEKTTISLVDWKL